MAKNNVPALKNGKFQEVPEKEIEYEFTSPSDFFGNSVNLVPMMNAVPPMRTFYTEKFYNQSTALQHPEVPYVQTLKDKETGETFEQAIGKKMGVVSVDPEDGDTIEITDVSPDSISYKTKDGSIKTKDLYNNFFFNRKSTIKNIPLVKKGDIKKAGDILAKSNYTADDGTLALGANAYTAIIPYKGWTMDDAIVISEDFAKKLTAHYAYGYQESDDKNVKTDKNHFASLFPKTFTNEQLKNIDDNGVVKVGAIVKEGDPLILSTAPRMISSKDSQLGRLSKYLRNTRTDASIKWDHGSDGIVTDVVKSKNGWKVNVETYSPARPGQKISSRSGNKCYHPDTEVFTENRGWVKIADLAFDDKVAALFDIHQDEVIKTSKGFIRAHQEFIAKFVHPIALSAYDYDGELYGLDACRASYLVTPNHRVWSASVKTIKTDTIQSRWICSDAHETHLKNRSFMIRSDFDLSDRIHPTTVKIPYIPYQAAVENLHAKQDPKYINQTEFETEPFVIFMALFLAEGNIKHDPNHDTTDMSIIITQKNRDFCRVIENVLDRLNFRWQYVSTTQQYRISAQKSLRMYLKQFGKHASEKFIPDWIKQLPKDLLELFFATYSQGDGDKSKVKHFWSTSQRLINDLADIATLLGEVPIISARDRRNETPYPASNPKYLLKHNYICYELSLLDTAVTVAKPKHVAKCYYKQQYTGKVYCCQVPGLGVILTRYKGKQMWNGNSVVSKIIPQELMPRDSEGRAFDVLFNPLGLVSRVNANLIYEVLLGKVAEKTGKPYKLPAFNGKDEAWYDFVKSELDKNGVAETDKVYDPEADKWIENPVTTGNMYILNLHHSGESKLSARGQGLYSSENLPVKGGDEGTFCFTANTQINTLYGPIDIGTLCEKKLRLPVLTYDFQNQEWCYKPVTDWCTRKAKLEELITVKFNTNSFRITHTPFKIFNQGSIHVTKNHLVFDANGNKVPIGSLHVGDNLYTYGPIPNKDQLALIYGSLLGNGYVHKDEDAICFFQHACISQQGYCSNWKQKILSGLFARTSSTFSASKASKNSISDKSVNAITVGIHYPWLAKKIRRECYSPSGRKTVTKEWLDNLTELGIVALFLDAGSLSAFSKLKRKYRAEIALYSFSKEENQMIADRIKELTGINFRVIDAHNTYKGEQKTYIGGQLISTRKEDCEKMIKLIMYYCDLNDIPRSKKQIIKLIMQYNDLGINPEKYKYNLDNKTGLIPVEIKSIEPYKHDKPNATEINVYDFTVEDTHAYLAGNVIVSNSKKLSGLENTSLLSAGAYNVIKDAFSLRGQQNDEYWRKVRANETPSLSKKSPFVWNKFIAILQGSGFNPIKHGANGEILRLSPFTDKQLEETFKPTELKNGEIIDFRTLQPVEGGLFDPAMNITNKWGKITLSEPIINPPFENVVASLLGIKKADMYAIISGEKDLEKYGTGTTAIQKALKDIDIKKMFNESVEEFKSGPKTHKQRALNRMNYIKGLVRNQISPDELIITKIPVLPQAFRPYSMMGETFIPGDANELYKEVFNVNQAHKELKEELGEEEARANSMNLYKAVKALYGTEESDNTKLKQRGVSGFMDKLVGGTAKFSFAQSKLFSKPVDFSGRGVINPDPNLSMDEIGLPYDIAWKIYAPWVQRELTRQGIPLADSVKEVEEKTPKAKQALEKVVKEKAVMYSRAPAWHRYNSLGAFAKLHDGKNILINPLTASGLGADYDGDYQINYIFLALPQD